MNGAFVISLDFELNWGTFDGTTIEAYGENLLGVRQVVPSLLDLFAAHQIHVTWATVGFLFYETKAELLKDLPTMQPTYRHPEYSSYNWMQHVGADEASDPYHFGKSLVDQIISTPGQTIGTHTYCHLSCLEEGVTIEAFKADLEAAKRVAARRDVPIQSIVYPRNQSSPAHFKAAQEVGIDVYRGNETHYIYRADARGDEGLGRRALRLLDAYVNVTGHHTVSWEAIRQSSPYNVPSSRFLRPYVPALRLLDRLKLRRIKRSMTHAAKTGQVFHLWWHPHNFGKHLSENMAMLSEIVAHYETLHQTYQFESLSMEEVADRCRPAVVSTQERHG